MTLSTVMSPLDYANAILVGLPEVDISKLQCHPEYCKEDDIGLPNEDSATECLWQVHWFPIRKRIKHKVLTMVLR